MPSATRSAAARPAPATRLSSARSCRRRARLRRCAARRRCRPSRIPRPRRARPAAATDLGFPVVVKTAAAGAHKTESGGVALNLADSKAVRAAVERIGGPVIVQPMVRGGAELLAGAVQDPVFGPLVAFGAGGVFA